MEERLTGAAAPSAPTASCWSFSGCGSDFPLPCPGGEGVYLTGEQLAQRQRGRAVFCSRTLGACYFTYRSGSGTRFVLFDDGDTLRRKIALGRQLGITRGLLTLPECGDILDEVIRKKNPGAQLSGQRQTSLRAFTKLPAKSQNKRQYFILRFWSLRRVIKREREP